MKNLIKIVMGTVVITLVALAVVYGELLYKEIERNNKTEEDILKTQKWEISLAEQSNSQFKLFLVNNSNEKQTISGVLAYKLSFNKEQIAVLDTESKLSIYNLNSTEKYTADFDFTGYKINYNNVLAWNTIDTLVTFFGNNDIDSSVVIFTNKAVFTNKVEAYGYFESSKIMFDPYSKLDQQRFLLRTISQADLSLKKEDGTIYNLEELPVFLTVYSVDGRILANFRISELMPYKDLFYRWNPELADYIEYNFSGSALYPLNVVKL